MKTKIRTEDGDFYVATSSKDWPAAYAQSQEQAQARRTRMRAWEETNHPGRYPDAEYWAAYRAEKYRIPIDWPMPEGHVIFE